MSNSLHLPASPFDLFRENTSSLQRSEATKITEKITILKQSLLDSSVKTSSIVNSIANIIDLSDYDNTLATPDWNDQVRSVILNEDDDSDDYAVADECLSNLISYVSEYGTNNKLSITTSNGEVINLQGNYDNVAAYDITSGTYKRIFYKTYDSASSSYNIHVPVTFPTLRANSAYALPDLLNDLRNSEITQEILSDSIQLDSENLGSYELGDALRKYESNCNDDVRTTINGLVSASKTSGLGGVLNYIKDLYNNLSTVTQDTDGLIDFLDDSQYAPKTFLCGVIGQAIESVALAVSAIVSIASPILGMLGFAITGAVSLVRKYIETSILAKGRINNSIGTTPMYPVSFIANDNDNVQWATSHPDPEGYHYQNVIEGYKIPHIVHYGCGYYIISSDGSKVRINGFIDTVDRTNALRQIYNAVERETWPAESTPSFHEYIYTFNTDYFQDLYDSTNGLKEFIPEYSEDSTGLSDSDDRRLRLIIGCNFVMTLCQTYGPFDDGIKENLAVYTSNVDHSGVLLNNYDASHFGMTSTEFKHLVDIFAAVARYVYTGEVGSYIDSFIAWDDLYYAFKAIENCPSIKDGTNDLISTQLWQGKWFLRDAHSIRQFNSKLLPSIIPANYNPSELLGSMILVTTVAIAAIIAVAVCSITARRKIVKKSATNAAKTERAWNKFVQDPSDQNFKDFESMRLKNNIWASVFGGTKYSKLSYWNQTSTDNTGSVKSKILNNIRENDNNYDTALSTIYKVVTGRNLR